MVPDIGEARRIVGETSLRLARMTALADFVADRAVSEAVESYVVRETIRLVELERLLAEIASS